MTPLISIGMPVRNGGASLRDAIESVLAQDFRDFELFICDNNSVDQTANICAQYSNMDSRIRVFRQERDISASENFQFVLSATKSEFFMWAAHDDCRAPTFISRSVAALRRNPNAVASICDIATLNEETGEQSVYRFAPVIEQHDAVERFRFILIENAWGVIYGLFRRSALKRVAYVELPDGLTPDYNALELAMIGPIAYVPETLLSCKARNLDSHKVVARFGETVNRSILFWMLRDLVKKAAVHGMNSTQRRLVARAILSTALTKGTILNEYLRALNRRAFSNCDYRNKPELYLEWLALRIANPFASQDRHSLGDWRSR